MRFLGNYFDRSEISAVLWENGLSDVSASEAGALFSEAGSILSVQNSIVQTDLVHGLWVPGRIEVLGKHTDYAGGRSLLVAVEKGFAALVARNNTSEIKIYIGDDGKCITFDLAGNVVGDKSDLPGWATYPKVAIKRWAQNWGRLERGGVIAMKSNLPQASGMSSSSALVIAILMALKKLAGLAIEENTDDQLLSALDWAEYAGAVEGGRDYKHLKGEKGVGTLGGSQDHTAILCAKAGKLLHVSYQPSHIREYIDIPDGLVFCVAKSGVQAEKTAGAQALYNRAALNAGKILHIWNALNGDARCVSLSQIIESPAFEYDSWVNLLKKEDAVLANRFVQFYNETRIYIPYGSKALKEGELAAFGKWVRQSQKDAEELLGNQIDETVALVDMAYDLKAIASSSFGAGFGGAVWALVDEKHAPAFLGEWEEKYRARFTQRSNAAFFVDKTGPASFWI